MFVPNKHFEQSLCQINEHVRTTIVPNCQIDILEQPLFQILGTIFVPKEHFGTTYVPNWHFVTNYVNMNSSYDRHNVLHAAQAWWNIYHTFQIFDGIVRMHIKRSDEIVCLHFDCIRN